MSPLVRSLLSGPRGLVHLGCESRRPLGYAIVGGIFFSTALTLFVVPSVWLLLERLTRRRQAPAREIATVEAR